VCVCVYIYIYIYTLNFHEFIPYVGYTAEHERDTAYISDILDLKSPDRTEHSIKAVTPSHSFHSLKALCICLLMILLSAGM
jgi:hypothetical protein